MAAVGRRDWAQAEVRCMLCGRTLGRLIGPVPTGTDVYMAAIPLAQFRAYRPSDPKLPTVRLLGNEHFRCSSCGGRAITDEVELFSTYEDVVDDDLPKRRGRPPKRFRPMVDERLTELGLAG